MEFLSLSRRRSSSRNVPQRRWAKRNVCRSNARFHHWVFFILFYFHVYCEPLIHPNETLYFLLTKTTDSPKLPQETPRPVKCFHYFTRWVSSAWKDPRDTPSVMAHTRTIHRVIKGQGNLTFRLLAVTRWVSSAWKDPRGRGGEGYSL